MRVLEKRFGYPWPAILIGENAHIPLSGARGFGLFLLVDVCNLHKFFDRKWYLGSHGYATSLGGPMAHQVLADPSWEVTDHKNGNRLDCRMANLRGASRAQNNANKRKRRESKQLYKGVRQHSPARWSARIRFNGKEKYLGSFGSPEAAAKAYDLAAVEAWGDFSLTNFYQEKK